jgi:hypothetical protein
VGMLYCAFRALQLYFLIIKRAFFVCELLVLTLSVYFSGFTAVIFCHCGKTNQYTLSRLRQLVPDNVVTGFDSFFLCCLLLAVNFERRGTGQSCST